MIMNDKVRSTALHFEVSRQIWIYPFRLIFRKSNYISKRDIQKMNLFGSKTLRSDVNLRLSPLHFNEYILHAVTDFTFLVVPIREIAAVPCSHMQELPEKMQFVLNLFGFGRRVGTGGPVGGAGDCDSRCDDFGPFKKAFAKFPSLPKNGSTEGLRNLSRIAMISSIV